MWFISGWSTLYHSSRFLSPYQCHAVFVVYLEFRNADCLLLSMWGVFLFCFVLFLTILGFLFFQMNLRIAFSTTLKNCILNFNGDCFWQDGHFYCVNGSNPCPWDISPFSEGFFDFFLERLNIPVIQIIHLFGQRHTKEFFIICDYIEGSCFSIFFLSLFSFL